MAEWQARRAERRTWGEGAARDALGFASNVVIGVALDGARLQPGRGARAHRGRGRRAGAGDHARGLRPDADDRGGVLLPQPRRPGRRHDVLLGDSGAGPWTGWIGGWAIVVADIIVMANLAEIAAIYTFDLFGYETPSKWAVLAARLRVDRGDDVDLLRRHRGLRQHAVLPAHGRDRDAAGVRGGRPVEGLHADIPGSIDPSLGWFNPFAIDDLSALIAAFMLAIFIYWGWDSTVTVNEETKDATEGPGKAAVVATLILLGVYLVVDRGGGRLRGRRSPGRRRVGDASASLGGGRPRLALDNLLIIAVLTSAAASTQTTILPTTRTTLSMAAKGAAPTLLRAASTRST